MPFVAPQELILRIHSARLLLKGGGFAVDVREHDEAVHLLHAPTVFNKRGGEIIKQLRVGGPVAHHAEIAGGADDAAAEMMLPDPVHHDARDERILRTGEPVGQSRTPPRRIHARGRNNFGIRGVEDRKESRLHFFPRHIPIARRQDERLGRLAAIINNGLRLRRIGRLQRIILL